MSAAAIEKVGGVLNDGSRPLKERFRALFTLRGLGGPDAVAQMSRAFADPSALLKHEVAYCLGQMGHPDAAAHLRRVLADAAVEPIVRHEAGEALGALADPADLPLLRTHCDDPVAEVADTCRLAVARIEYVRSDVKEDLPDNPYRSVDPALPLPERDPAALRAVLLDDKAPLVTRYRAMFSLRNLGTDECVKSLAEGEPSSNNEEVTAANLCAVSGLKCDNALFRHEIAYVLGQIQSALGSEALLERLADAGENDMVRHECAEALGSIAGDDVQEELKKYEAIIDKNYMGKKIRFFVGIWGNRSRRF
jgi:deoxyhypusine monooxygenase